jgi:hypothetical protein
MKKGKVHCSVPNSAPFFFPASFFLNVAQIINDRQNSSVNNRSRRTRRQIDIIIAKLQTEVFGRHETVPPHWQSHRVHRLFCTRNLEERCRHFSWQEQSGLRDVFSIRRLVARRPLRRRRDTMRNSIDILPFLRRDLAPIGSQRKRRALKPAGLTVPLIS